MSNDSRIDLRGAVKGDISSPRLEDADSTPNRFGLSAAMTSELKGRACARQKLHDDAEFLPMPDCFSEPPGHSNVRMAHDHDTQKYPTMVSIDKLLWTPPVNKTSFFPPPLQQKS